MRDIVGFAGWLACVGLGALVAGYAFYGLFGHPLVALGVGAATAWIAIHVLQRHFERSAKQAFWAEARGAPDQQAVIVKIPLSNAEFGASEERSLIHRLAHQLEAAVTREQVGEYDGDEFGAGTCRLFLHGRNCEELSTVVQRVLAESGTASQATVVQRYGEPGARELRIGAPAA